MRLIAATCTLVIVAFVAVFGAILHERTIADLAPVAQSGASTASAPASEPVATSPITTVAHAASRGALMPEPQQAVAPQQALAPQQSAGQIFTQAPARPAAPAAAAPPAPTTNASCPGNPNALGVGRVVEVDTTGGPGFGFEHFKSHDFLQPGEVVLTFDDGPWPRRTPAVLAALAEHCT